MLYLYREGIKTVSSNYVTYQYIFMCNLVSVVYRYVKLVKMHTVAVSIIVNVYKRFIQNFCGVAGKKSRH